MPKFSPLQTVKSSCMKIEEAEESVDATAADGNRESDVQGGLLMLDHTLFDERPESQDRAIKVLERLGYQYIPRSQAEILRGRTANVLFPEVLREFLHRQSFFYRGRQTPFSGRSIGPATNCGKNMT